jgi:hypothetical protein
MSEDTGKDSRLDATRLKLVGEANELVKIDGLVTVDVDLYVALGGSEH